MVRPGSIDVPLTVRHGEREVCRSLDKRLSIYFQLEISLSGSTSVGKRLSPKYIETCTMEMMLENVSNMAQMQVAKLDIGRSLLLSTWNEIFCRQ